MSSGGNFRRFESEKHAKLYAQYRPTYTDEMFSAIFSFCEKDPEFSFDKALDVACGSGQKSTRPLRGKFRKVFGQDISQAQITQAQKSSLESGDNNDIEYSVGNAEDLSAMGESSVDLITCAQSFHWLDFEKVYGETKKALKPHGVLAVYGYGLVELSKSEATATVQSFWRETLKEYWPSVREYVNQRFKGIELPFDDFQRNDELVICRRMPLSSFIGYLASSSAYQQLLKDDPESTIMAALKNKLVEIYKEDAENDADFHLDVHWPIFLLMGRNTGK